MAKRAVTGSNREAAASPTWSIKSILDALSQPHSLAAVSSLSAPFSTTSQGPVSVKKPNMELAPGPPLSHIVSAEVGSRPSTNQKNRLVGESPGTVTQPVYCFCVSKAVLQAPLGTL